MQFVGLDVHLKHISACVMDEAGQIQTERKINNNPEEFDKLLAYVDKDNSKFTVEACSCWEYVYDYLTEAGYQVVLANPSRIGLIAKSKKKTDKADAKILANLLRTNMLPEAYAAPAYLRDYRQLTRHKTSLTRLAVQVKNKIHAILIRNGLVHGFSDVFGKEGIEYLKSLDLEMRDRYQMDNYLELLEFLKEKADKALERIEETEIRNPNVKLIRSHPGFDYQLALTVDAEIGDIRRFPTFAKLTSFAGLNPSVSQSGEKCYTGHISKQGNTNLRWALVQAAHVAVQHDSKYARLFHSLAARRNKNIAYVAVARRILKTLYYMLKHNAYYIPHLEERKAS